MTDNEFNTRMINCKLSALNQIILPKRIADEYKIIPRDKVGFLGKRPRRVGIIAFNVAVLHNNNSICIPKEVIKFCEFKPGSEINLQMIGIRRAPPDLTISTAPSAPPVVS